MGGARALARVSGLASFRERLARGQFEEIAEDSVRVESRTNLNGFDFVYASRPSWDVYARLLRFAATVRRDVADLRPRALVDIQSFIWVQGSDENAE